MAARGAAGSGDAGCSAPGLAWAMLFGAATCPDPPAGSLEPTGALNGGVRGRVPLCGIEPAADGTAPAAVPRAPVAGEDEDTASGRPVGAWVALGTRPAPGTCVPASMRGAAAPRVAVCGSCERRGASPPLRGEDAAVASTSSAQPALAPTGMMPPHTEQRARSDTLVILAGSTRKTERHSGQVTFIGRRRLEGKAPRARARARSPSRVPDGDRWRTRSREAIWRSLSSPWQVRSRGTGL